MKSIVGRRYMEFVKQKYKSARVHKPWLSGPCYVWHKGSPWAIGRGETKRAAWRDAARRLCNRGLKILNT